MKEIAKLKCLPLLRALLLMGKSRLRSRSYAVHFCFSVLPKQQSVSIEGLSTDTCLSGTLMLEREHPVSKGQLSADASRDRNSLFSLFTTKFSFTPTRPFESSVH